MREGLKVQGVERLEGGWRSYGSEHLLRPRQLCVQHLALLLCLSGLMNN